MYGYAGGGLFGYSHLYGGYSGGQAEYVRVPFADFGPVKIEDGLSDEDVLLLTDVVPTGYMAAENCDIASGTSWRSGAAVRSANLPIRSALMLGAGRVIAIDRFDYRLDHAKSAGAEIINHDKVDNLLEALYEVTGGRGPDAVIDCVGMEAHGTAPDAAIDYLKQTVKLQADRPHACAN